MQKLPRLLGLSRLSSLAGKKSAPSGWIRCWHFRPLLRLSPSPVPAVCTMTGWRGAGEHTQRTVAQCPSSCVASWTTGAFLENRRIRGAAALDRKQALALRESHTTGTVTHIDAMAADIQITG